VRKHFAAYFRPGPADFARLHAGVVSLDANVLLNLYRYSPETRDEFLALLVRLQGQLWLTHQAAAEFHQNRLKVIARVLGGLADARGKVQAAKEELSPRLTELYRAPSTQSKARLAKVTDAWKALEAYLDSLQEEVVQPTADPSSDPVWDRVLTLFDGRIGEPYPPDVVQELEGQGRERYAKKVPPGYQDEQKPVNAFGDWLLWRQLMDHAKLVSEPIVLVIDDRKDDWWLSAGNRQVAPRPELIEEMAQQTAQPFYMYQPDQFLTAFGSATKQEASAKAIKEVASLPPIATTPIRTITVSDVLRSRELASIRAGLTAAREELARVDEELATRVKGQRKAELQSMRAALLEEVASLVRRDDEMLRRPAYQTYDLEIPALSGLFEPSFQKIYHLFDAGKLGAWSFDLGQQEGAASDEDDAEAEDSEPPDHPSGGSPKEG